MRAIIAFIALCFTLTVWAYAQEENAPVKPRPLPRMGSKVLIVGPKDSLTVPRTISGSIRLMAAFPSTVKATEVEFFMDGNSIGKCASKPFRLDVDASKYKTGEHVFKAIARDGSSDTWTASSKARVELHENPAPGAEGVDPTPIPDELAAQPVATPSQPNIMPVADDPEASPAQPGAGALPLGKAYLNREYGFSINYPSSWPVRDDTAAVAKSRKCSFWVAFGEDPITINIHSQPLSPSSDAKAFARHNPYVQSWTSKTISGKPAFATTTGSPADRNVTHRLIIIDNGRAWMLNCTDKSGAPSADSAQLFENVIRTFQPQTKPSPKPKH